MAPPGSACLCQIVSGTTLPQVLNAQVTEFLRRARKAQKWSMRAAAKNAGISPTTWSDLEGGKSPPSEQTQRCVAQALNVNVDWYDRLLAGRDPVEASAVTALGYVAPSAVATADLRTEIRQLSDAAKKRDAKVDEIAAEVQRLGDQLRRLLLEDDDL